MHHLDEIFRICDRVTVLRNGETSHDELVRGMVGQQLQREMASGAISRAGEGTALSLVNFRRAQSPHADGISLDLHKGEILGITAFWRTSRPGRRSWMSTIRPARTQLSSIGVQRGALSVDVETFGARNENPLWTLVIIATGASCKQCDGDGQVLRGDLHGYDHTSHHSTRSSTARRRLVRPRTLVLSRANTPGA